MNKEGLGVGVGVGEVQFFILGLNKGVLWVSEDLTFD